MNRTLIQLLCCGIFLLFTESSGAALTPIDSSGCISYANGSRFIISPELYDATDIFRFCPKTNPATMQSGQKYRFILVLDNSASMCSNPTSREGCCAVGDSSGMCSMNDPTNRRTVMAHALVDTLRKIGSGEVVPRFEFGVVSFISGNQYFKPVSLENDEKLADLHSFLNRDTCTEADRTRGIGKTATPTGIKMTFLGSALQQALSLVDEGYDSPGEVSREIILLTDGAWDDAGSGRSPEEIFNGYRAQFPDRPLPRVHAIFLSDTLTHIMHLYPAEGCSANEFIERAYLEYTTSTTGGLYFPSTTPETVRSVPGQLISYLAGKERWPEAVSFGILNLTTDTRATVSGMRLLTDGSGTIEFSVERLSLGAGENTVVISCTGGTVSSDTINIVKSPVSGVAMPTNSRVSGGNLLIAGTGSGAAVMIPRDVRGTAATITLFTFSGRITRKKVFARMPERIPVRLLRATTSGCCGTGILRIDPEGRTSRQGILVF